MRWRGVWVLVALVVCLLAVSGSVLGVLELERTLDLPAAVDGETFETATWSEEGTWVAACSRSSGDAVVWNTSDWAVAQHVSLSLASCKDMQFSPNEEFLMVVGDDGSDTKGEYSINTSTWAVTDLAIGGCCRKDSVEFLPNGDYVQIGTRNLGGGISNLSARVVPSFNFHDSNTATMNGDPLFDCDWMDTVRVLCTGSGRIGKAHVPNVQREEFLGSFSDTAISLDLDISTSRILVLSSGEILVLDMDDGSTLATWDSGLSADEESQIEFSASRDVGVVSYHDTAGGVQELRAYLADSGDLVDTLELPSSDVRGLNFSRTDDRFAVAGSGGVFVVDADTEGAFLEPDVSASLAGDAQEVAVSDHLLSEDVRVYARDRGGVDTSPRESNLHRFDADLTLLNQKEDCAQEPGQNAYFLGGGLALTSDNFPVTVCEESGLERPLLKMLNQDFSLHPEGSHVVLDSLDGLTNLAADTGNKVVWANQTQTAQGESDIPNVETTAVDRLVVDVDVDKNSSLVLGVGDGGVWVEQNVSGSLVVHDGTITGHTAGVIGSNDSKEWVWLAGDGASVERYEVGSGSLTLNGSLSSGVSPHTLALSQDARYLVVVGNDGLELVDAASMSVLNETFGGETGTSLDLRSAAMDACNNYIYAVAGDAAGQGDGEVLRYPAFRDTSCEGFGGTDSTGTGGVNEPAEGTQDGDEAEGEQTTGQDGEPIQDTGTQDIEAPSVVVETGQSNVGLEVEPRDSFRVWVRDRGDPAGNHTRVKVFDSGLGLLHDRFACTESGTYEAFKPWTGLDALSATSDGQGLVACEHVDEGVGLGLFLLGEDGLPESGSEFDDFSLIPDAGAVLSVSARSAADVVFTGRSATTNDERVCQASFSALVSSTPCRFLEEGLADAHISKHPDLPWVVFSQGGWGTGVDEEIGGTGVLPRSGDGHTSVRIDGDTIFTWTSPPGSGELERWEVVDGTMVRTHVRSIGGSSAFPLTAALGLSPEGQVLALIETGEISVRRADNLDALAVLEGMADARGVAVGPSLERVYAINETHVAAWDVSDAVSVAGITAEPVGVETFAEATAEDEEDEDVVTEPVQPGEDGIFGDGIMQIIADGFGVNQFGARAFVAGALITGFALSGASIAGGAGAAVAAAGATVLAFGGGLLPLWLLLGLFLIGGGLLVFWRG